MYGNAKGVWKGNKPEVDRSYHVEFDTTKILTWGIDITKSACREYKLWSEQDTIFLNVKMEQYENVGLLTVRFGDSVFLIETEGIPYNKGSNLLIKLNEILLYPFDL